MKSQDNNPRLVVIEGKDKGKIFSLKHGTMIIGRSKADIVIQDPRISRSHISLEYDAKSGKIQFTDLRSLNGTIINDELLEKGELKDGDKLQLGNTVFDCQVGISEATIPAQTLPKKKEAKKEKENKNTENTPTDEEADLKGSPSIHRLEPKLGFEEKEEDASLQAEAPTRLRGRRFSPEPKHIRIAALVGVLILIGLLSRITSKPAVDTLTRIQQVQGLQKDGKLAEAFKLAEGLAKDEPENSLAQYLYADLAYNQNKLEDAINILRKAHGLKDVVPLVHVRLAKAYNRGGLGAEALEELKHVDEQLKGESGKDKEFVTQAAILLSEMKVNPEKTLELARLLKNTLWSDNTIGYKIESGVLLDLKHSDEAISVLEQGLKIDPKDEVLLERLSFARLTNKDLPGALKTLQTWIDLNPKATKPLLVMAYLKFNEKEYLAALPYLRNVTQILADYTQDPDYSEALHLTGKIYQEQNQKTEATQIFQKACSLGFQESCAALQALSTQTQPESKSIAPASVKENSPSTLEATTTTTAPAVQPSTPAAPEAITPQDQVPTE